MLIIDRLELSWLHKKREEEDSAVAEEVIEAVEASEVASVEAEEVASVIEAVEASEEEEAEIEEAEVVAAVSETEVVQVLLPDHKLELEEEYRARCLTEH